MARRSDTHQHAWQLSAAYQYLSPVGEATKLVYECACKEQTFSRAFKGHWTVEQFEISVTDGGKTSRVFKHHQHTYYTVAQHPYTALGGPHTRQLGACSCGSHQVVTAKGWRD